MKKLLAISALLQTLLFASYDGIVVDKNTNKAINKAIISDSKTSVKSDENGTFSIKSKETQLHIKAYGYRPYTFTPETNSTTISVEPIKIKDIYLNF